VNRALLGFLSWTDTVRHRARLRAWPETEAWGRRAEDLAQRHLEAQGLTTVARNWRKWAGAEEIDLAATDGSRLVVVEVKSRRDAAHGLPDRAIDAAKLRRLRRAALALAQQLGFSELQVRLDLVAVVFSPYSVRHIPDAWSIREPDRIS
jgi:putative endonuclease